jgi:hypothetical protein
VKNSSAGNSYTAFGETQRDLQRALKNATLNVSSFDRLSAPCDINDCKGMCCYDGVYVNEEEERVLTQLAHEKSEFFESVGAAVPKQPIVAANWPGIDKVRKTAVVPRDFRTAVPTFPPHFEQTACVFLTDEGRCSLQLLAVSEGKHRWYYKPLVCAVHPIRISVKSQLIELPTEETDPHFQPEYPGFISATHCGRRCTKGVPAFEALNEELVHISRMINRDLCHELKVGRNSNCPSK